MNISMKESGGMLFGAGFLPKSGGLKSAVERQERKAKSEREIAFLEKQKENLKNKECSTLEEIERKLEMFHTYEDEIAAVKASYNREEMFHILDEAKEQVLYGLTKCDILKISDNEIQWLTGEEDYTEGVKRIREKNNIPLILVSLGKEGSRAYYKKPGSGEEIMVEVMPFLQENTIETTGAGDTFGGCILNYILEKGLNDLSENDLKEMLTFANGAASIITTRKGALRVMPGRDEVEKLINLKQ